MVCRDKTYRLLFHLSCFVLWKGLWSHSVTQRRVPIATLSEFLFRNPMLPLPFTLYLLRAVTENIGVFSLFLVCSSKVQFLGRKSLSIDFRKGFFYLFHVLPNIVCSSRSLSNLPHIDIKRHFLAVRVLCMRWGLGVAFKIPFGGKEIPSYCTKQWSPWYFLCRSL